MGDTLHRWTLSCILPIIKWVRLHQCLSSIIRPIRKNCQAYCGYFIIALLISGGTAFGNQAQNHCLHDQLAKIKSPFGIRASSRLQLYQMAWEKRHSTFTESERWYFQWRYDLDFGPDAWLKLKSLGVEFAELGTDPGLVQRLDSFIRFVKKRNLSKEDPWKARKLFAESLGYKKAYRALALSPTEYEQVIREGLHSRVLRNENILDSMFTENLSHRVLNRILGQEPEGDSFLSITDYPEIAEAVAARYATPEQGKKVYLFELKVPVIDTIFISQNGPFRMGYYSKDIVTKKIVLLPSMKNFSFDAKAESFVMYKIEPSEIIGAKEVDLKSISELSFREMRVDEKMWHYLRTVFSSSLSRP